MGVFAGPGASSDGTFGLSEKLTRPLWTRGPASGDWGRLKQGLGPRGAQRSRKAGKTEAGNEDQFMQQPCFPRCSTLSEESYFQGPREVAA